MSERCLSFDLEWSTRDYPSGVRDGDLACFQCCELLASGATTEPEVLAGWPGADKRAREVFADALLSPSWILLGQNVAGDVLKAALTWGLLAEADRAYQQGRVRCTMLAQRLIDVAWPGRFVWRAKAAKPRKGQEVDLDEVDDSEEEARGAVEGYWKIIKLRPDRLLGREVAFTTDDEGGGRGMLAKAGLADLAARYLGLAVSKGADTYRMRYGELIGTPVDEWPGEAVRYAREDPRLTAQVRVEQVKRPPAPHAGPWCDIVYPPRDAPPWAPLRCERFEAYYAFTASDMERLGLARDQPRVEAMRETLRRAALSAEGTAIRSGVVRLDVSRDMTAIAKLKAAHAADPATPAPPDKSGLPDLKAAQALADRRDLAALDAFIASRPWLVVERCKDSKEVLSRAEALYRAAGMRELPRTDSGSVSAGAEHLQQVVRPRPDAEPDAAADLRELVGPDLLAHLQRWTDSGEVDRITRALDAANDPGLAAHMARQKCQTFDSSFLASIDERHRATRPDKWRDPKGPARFGISTFKSTGRTGIRGDVRQNMPSSGGVRECFVPRPGRVFLVRDWAAGEMSTLADVLDETVLGGVGWSTLGQAIRAGDDCHLRLAAVMRREPYAELREVYVDVKERREAEHEDAARARYEATTGRRWRPVTAAELKLWKSIDLDRKGAKEGNFGYAGGMGAKKFARLQRKKGRDCDEARARFIRDAWLEAWSPEVPAYFALAAEATGGRGERKSATVVHMRGGHVRGGLDYCQWANTGFQELLARGAKRAGILLFRACRIDQTSPLYGVADPVLFVHDEYVLECDEAHAEAGLEEQGRLMAEGMRSICRTPVKSEGRILRERWSK